MNGQIVSTCYAPPYQASFVVPDGVSQVVIRGVAVDLAGHEGTSDPVTLTVIPDDQPTIHLLTPLPGDQAVEGTMVRVAAQATDDVHVSRVMFYVDGELKATATSGSYRFLLTLPSDGTTSVEVTAVAVDTRRPDRADGPVTLTVVPDEPPTVAILAPTDGSQVVGGSRVADRSRRHRRFRGDRGAFPSRWRRGRRRTSAPPYQHAFRVEEGASEVRLSAIAVDTRGQETASAEVVVGVIADPGTTASGRVVGVDGDGMPGVDVSCLTATGSSGRRRFVLRSPEVPTASGRIVCTAAAVGAGGATLNGSSATVPPSPDGITDVGDIVLAPALLYLASGDPAGFSPAGRLYVLDERGGTPAAVERASRAGRARRPCLRWVRTSVRSQLGDGRRRREQSVRASRNRAERDGAGVFEAQQSPPAQRRHRRGGRRASAR